MLKIKKLKPDDLESLTFNDYKKIVRPLFKAIKAKHAAPDQLVDFFIITDFEFSDKPGKKSTIFVPGKQDNQWKQFLKKKFNDDKKNVLIGKCYVGEQDGKPALSLLPERGKAKLINIKKQGKKMFNMVQLAVQLATSAQDATDDTLEEHENEENTNTSDTTARTDNNEGQGQQEQTQQATRELLKEQLVGLADQLKTVKQGLPEIKPIVEKYKQEEVTEEEASLLQDIVENMEDFVDGHQEAHQKVKERLQSAYDKVAGQLPKLQALLQKINILLEEQTVVAEDNDDEDTSTTSETSRSSATSDTTDQEDDNSEVGIEISTQEIEQLRQTMATAKNKVDQLLQEIDLDALVAQIA